MNPFFWPAYQISSSNNPLGVGSNPTEINGLKQTIVSSLFQLDYSLRRDNQQGNVNCMNVNESNKVQESKWQGK